MPDDITQLPSPLFSHRKPAGYRRFPREGDRLPVGMAMSTFQKVTLATCLVLCVALLLPKMLLSRGRKDAAERPEGASPFTVSLCPLRCLQLGVRWFKWRIDLLIYHIYIYIDISDIMCILVFQPQCVLTISVSPSCSYTFIPEEGAKCTETPAVVY